MRKKKVLRVVSVHEHLLDDPPIIRGLHFEGDNPREKVRKGAVEGGVACVGRLDVVKEGEKRDSVAEGVVKDYGEVVFIGGYETEIDRGRSVSLGPKSGP